MEILWVPALLFLLILGILMLLTIKDTKYFKDRGIFFLGNMSYSTILYNLTVADNSLYWYKKSKGRNLPIVGLKELLTPAIMITDPDLIKKIMVEDFEHFVDHRSFQYFDRDYLLKKFLPNTTGDHWKCLRNKITPAFSSGKIRRMFKIFDTSSTHFVNYLEKETENCTTIDLTQGLVKFTTDVIATVAFGFDIKAFNQKENSEFLKMAEEFKINLKGLEIVKFLFMEIFPKRLSEMLGLSVYSLDAQNYFSRLVKSEVNRRKKTGENLEDFIQLMIEAKEGKLKQKETEEIKDFEKVDEIKRNSNEFKLDDDDITAQCVVFIIAGLDATYGTLLFLSYLLALNPLVQDRLFQEISSSLEETGGEFTYESINRMEYLDTVVNETLRLFPPAPITNRACTKDYRIPDSNITIKKGEIIIIPILGIQHDAKNFEDPERFDPERWTAENRSKIDPYTFLPFGHGLRNCPGMRFATLQVKLTMAKMIHNFIIEPCEKTLIPMKFSSNLTLLPADGMWTTLTKRT